MSETPYSFPPLGVRTIGRVNWLGVWTLYKKEVMRFVNVWLQTLIAPMVTSLLFFTVFSLAIGATRPDVHGIPFVEFLAPGLIMMAVLQNAFANTGSSLLISKVQGNIVDSLMPPLSAGELTFAYAIGGATRGLVVAGATGLVLAFFVDLAPANFVAALFFAASASLLMSLVGILAGVWSDKFDHMAAVTNFVIMPMTFLSGTFYSVNQLPEAFQMISAFNPFFYMIDGFRAGITGYADSPLWLGAAIITGINIVLWVLCHRVFHTGWRLKA